MLASKLSTNHVRKEEINECAESRAIKSRLKSNPARERSDYNNARLQLGRLREESLIPKNQAIKSSNKNQNEIQVMK